MGQNGKTLSCFLGDFGLETVVYFTQASRKKTCQPNFDHFVWLPLHALGEVLVGVEFFIPEKILQFFEQEPVTEVQVWTVGALFDWFHFPSGQILFGIGGSMGPRIASH